MEKYRPNRNFDNDDDFPIEFEDLVIEPKYARKAAPVKAEPSAAPAEDAVKAAASADKSAETSASQAASSDISVEKAAQDELKNRAETDIPAPAPVKEALDIDDSIFDFSINNTASFGDRFSFDINAADGDLYASENISSDESGDSGAGEDYFEPVSGDGFRETQGGDAQSGYIPEETDRSEKARFEGFRFDDAQQEGAGSQFDDAQQEGSGSQFDAFRSEDIQPENYRDSSPAGVPLSLGRFVGYPLDEEAEPDENFVWFAENFAEGGNYDDEPSKASGYGGRDYDFEPEDEDRFSYGRNDDEDSSGFSRADDEDRFSYSTIEEERRLAAAERAEEAKRLHRKKSGKGFKIGLIIYTILLILVFAGGNYLLWKFMAEYEKTTPEVVVEEVISRLKSGNISGLNLTTIDDVSLSAPEDDILIPEGTIDSYLSEKMSGDVTYEEVDALRSDDGRVYVVQSDGSDFAQVSISKTGQTGMFDKLSEWEETSARLMNSDLTAESFVIQVPSGNFLYVAETQLDDSYITGSSIVSELLDLQSAGIITEVPSYDIYSVTGLFNADDIYTVDDDGQKETLEYDADQGMYTAGYTATEEFAAAEKEHIKQLVQYWAYYYTGDCSIDGLSDYLLAGSPAYTSIDSMDRDFTLYETMSCDENLAIDTFRSYTDTCFSCSVYFTIDEVSPAGDEFSSTWNMTWILVKSGDNYYLADYSKK